MTQSASPGFDVGGDVQVEVFVLWLDEATPRLAGPCGPAPWYLEVGAREDPLAVVTTAVQRVIGKPIAAHSTSWRTDRGGVILSFVVVIEPELGRQFADLPVQRTDLARNTATEAPAEIAYEQVLEHGLRHLAWLVQHDAVVADRLDAPWKEVLRDYVPQPFRHL